MSYASIHHFIINGYSRKKTEKIYGHILSNFTCQVLLSKNTLSGEKYIVMRTTAWFCLLGVPELIQLNQQLNSCAIPWLGFGWLLLLLKGSSWLIKTEELSNFRGGCYILYKQGFCYWLSFVKMIMTVYYIASYMGLGKKSACAHLKHSYCLLSSCLIPSLLFRGVWIVQNYVEFDLNFLVLQNCILNSVRKLSSSVSQVPRVAGLCLDLKY